MSDFYIKFARILNSGQSRSVVFHGNVYDLFWDGEEYVPLIALLLKKTAPADRIQIVYELNGPIRISDNDQNKLKKAWVRWKSGSVSDHLFERTLGKVCIATAIGHTVEKYEAEFDQNLNLSIGNSTHALEFLRQLCFCSRETLEQNLLVFIEAADMLIPAGNGDVAGLNDVQLRRISIIQDWFGEPAFMNAGDAICLVAESRSLIHPRVSRLPQVVGVEVPSPSCDDRKHFISQYCINNKVAEVESEDVCPTCKQLVHVEECHGAALDWSDAEQKRLATMAAGLSIHALRQLMAESIYLQQPLSTTRIVAQVEEFIQSQVGEDVIEFKRPHHKLDAVVGASTLVEFIQKELIPRFRTTDPKKALPGCAVAGPIGSGKTYIFEAVAAELDMPVLVLKNLRSQWFGQTDVIFERLKRALEALEKVVIFVDEADTQFGGIGADSHATERRLTGKIQQMMSDPRLRGKIIWMLMTARIHLLSPDIRRPGRVGDLILPVLDPKDQDRKDFIRWAIRGIVKNKQDIDALVEALDVSIDESYSAAAFAALRSHLVANYKPDGDMSDKEQIELLIEDLIPPAIGKTREYQKLQALINCTRKSLLPDKKDWKKQREVWLQQVRVLEAEGIS